MTISPEIRTAQPRRGPAATSNQDKLRIVFLTGKQAVYECLSHAAQQYFSRFDIVLLDKLPSAFHPEEGVNLVLLGGALEVASPEYVADCRQRFPGAAICLMVDGSTDEFDSDLIEHHLVEGVLPLSLPLDVWLAVVSLLVSGGEYLLPGMNHATKLVSPGASIVPSKFSPVEDREPQRPAPPASVGQDVTLDRAESFCGTGSDDTENAKRIAVLTTREREILQLVSEGYQNKIIADRMALSEHTVKAHVHNLIAKLRVTNRTQAAAFLYDQRIAHNLHPSRSSVGIASLTGS